MPSEDRTPTADLSGEFVDNGKILLLEVLGSGGFGIVYKAVDTKSPPTRPLFFAVKCMLKPSSGSRQAAFQANEFSLHSLVSQHPNIVTFVKTFSDEAYVFVVLQLAKGGDLFHALTKQQILVSKDDALVKKLFVQVIDAVRYCHEKGVYHRDIKPDNILCTEDGNVLLCDFGLSTSVESSRDFRCGSANYMSPECIGRETKGMRYSHRTNDIWALGVLLVNMISNRHPWHLPTSEDPCYRAYMRNPDWLRQMLPISSSAANIIHSIFVLDPTSRISLSRLRQEILAIDTFFRDTQEVIVSSANIAPQAAHRAASCDVTVEIPSAKMNICADPGKLAPEMDIAEISEFAGGDGSGIRLVGAYRKADPGDPFFERRLVI